MAESAEGMGSSAPVGAAPPAAAPRIAMLFTATAWTFNVRLGRTGREEGEGVILMGEVSYRAGAERRVHPARAMLVKADARKKLDVVISPQDTVLTIPLEPFAMQRLQDRLKDLVAFYGMSLRIAFSAIDSAERQTVDTVDFAFSSPAKKEPHRPLPDSVQSSRL
jgi:hypothetical protein